jgi:hypothetical protein
VRTPSPCDDILPTCAQARRDAADVAVFEQPQASIQLVDHHSDQLMTACVYAASLPNGRAIPDLPEDAVLELRVATGGLMPVRSQFPRLMAPLAPARGAACGDQGCAVGRPAALVERCSRMAGSDPAAAGLADELLAAGSIAAVAWTISPARDPNDALASNVCLDALKRAPPAGALGLRTGQGGNRLTIATRP